MSQDLIMDAEKKASLRHFLSAAMIFSPSWPKEPVTAEQKAHGDAMYARALTAFDEWFSLHKVHPQKSEAQPVQFLANGTRFKMAFFENEDANGNRIDGTHVNCFEAYEKELDGRWVALVSAEDDCHLRLAALKALEPVAWSTVHRAVCMAVEQCKSATGQRSHIDLVVNTTQITHDILGTDTSIAAPHSGRATDAGSGQP